jgi:hypothetical protein
LDDIQETQILRRAFPLSLIIVGAARRNPLYAGRGRRAFHLPGYFRAPRVQLTPQLGEQRAAPLAVRAFKPLARRDGHGSGHQCNHSGHSD